MSGTDDELLDRDRVMASLERALEAVADETDGAEIVLRGQRADLLRFGESSVIQAARTEQAHATVRAFVDGRAARVGTDALDDASLAACAREAATRARSMTAPEVPLAPLEAREPPRAPDWARDETTAALDGATKRAWLDEALRAHRRNDRALAGRLHTGTLVQAVRSSTGTRAWHEGTVADVGLGVLEQPAGHAASGWRESYRSALDADTVRALEREARADCLRARRPTRVEPGAWDVVLGPAAVAELLQWLTLVGFDARAWEDGRSFALGRLGERVTGSAITVVDDASMPYGVGVPLPFDVEGAPKQRVELLQEGVARGIVHDAASARRHDTTTTGHAALAEALPTGDAHAAHLHLAPGTANDAELVAGVERGLYVPRFHYVNGYLEPRRAVMTGLLRDGAGLIEDGRVVRGVEPMRFTDSILEAFARIPGPEALSRTVQPHAPLADPWACTVTPWMLVPGLRFTSGR